CDETEELMPLPISLAHQMAKRLADIRKDETLPYLLPDGKTQVTVEYDDVGNPERIDTIVISTQHHHSVTHEQIENYMIIHLIHSIAPDNLLDDETYCIFNLTGRFVRGGLQWYAGLTGRKIIVDTFGGYARHGGRAFSCKDVTKF